MVARFKEKPATKQQTGQLGERLVCEHLLAQGYTLYKRNYHCRYGEIDIVAMKEGLTYFVEVKTRRSLAFGHPYESITPAKILKIKKSISIFRETEYVQFPKILFAAVLLDRNDAATIELLPYEG